MPTNRPFSPGEVASKIFNLGIVSPSNRLVRRELVENEGLRFQEITSCNDMVFSLAALAVAKRITTVEEPLLHVRRGHPRTLAGPVEEQALNAYRALIGLRDFLRERGLYAAFAQSFENWALDFSVGMTQVFGGHLGIRLRQRLVRGGFEELGLLGHAEEPEYFYYPWRVRDMERILHGDAKGDGDGSECSVPLATIIVPCPRETLSRRFAVAVESAAMQDYPSIEVLAILDGERKELVAKAREYESDGVRIIDRNIYSSDAAAFVAALDSAAGEYVVVLEPDDFLDARFLGSVIRQMREMAADVGACSRSFFTHDVAGSMFPTGDRIFEWEDDYLAPIQVSDDLSLFTRIDSSRGMVVAREVMGQTNIRFGNGDGYAALLDAWAAGCLAHATTLAAVDMELWYRNQCPVIEQRAGDCSVAFASVRDGVADTALRAGLNRRWVRRVFTDAAHLPRERMVAYLREAQGLLGNEIAAGRMLWGDMRPEDAGRLRELQRNAVKMLHREQGNGIAVVCDVAGEPSLVNLTLSSLAGQTFAEDGTDRLNVICAIPFGVDVPEVVQRYVASDRRFRIVYFEDDEDIVDVAMNYARAPFIVYARSGDSFDPGFLGSSLARARKENLDVLYGSDPFANDANLLAGTVFRAGYLGASTLHAGRGLGKDTFLAERALAFAGRTAVNEDRGVTPALDAMPSRPLPVLRDALLQLLEDIAPINDAELDVAVKARVLPTYLLAIAEADVAAVQSESLALGALQSLLRIDGATRSAMPVQLWLERLTGGALDDEKAHQWIRDFWRERSKLFMSQLRNKP